MKIGTRSVLFGAHQFLIHPICLALAITPEFLYLISCDLTGELAEYMANGKKAQCPPCTVHEVWCLHSNIPIYWHDGLRRYMLRWVAKHHHDQDDSWTQLETTR